MKICTKCKLSKDFSAYGKHSLGKAGLHPQCKPCANASARQSKQKYRSQRLAAQRQYAADFPELKKLSNARWRANNRGTYNAIAGKYIASKRQAVPVWLTQDQKAEIKEIYQLAQDLAWLGNEPLHVDHIVPLRGKEVCGLHVPWNLQIISRSANVRKGNRL